MKTTINVPQGFVNVPQDKFFSVIGQRNVTPNSEKFYTNWETPSRQLMGFSTPGYLLEDEDGNYCPNKKWYLKLS